MHFYVFLINKKPEKQQIAVQKRESPQSSAIFVAGRHPPKEGDIWMFPFGNVDLWRVNLKQKQCFEGGRPFSSHELWTSQSCVAFLKGFLYV